MARGVIAVDLGGTNLRIAVVKNGKIIKLKEVKTPKNEDRLIKEICEGIEGFNSWKIRGIGVSCPGPLENGIIKNPPNIPFKNFDLKNYLKDKYKKKVEVENDANCVAIAELKLGCKKKNFVVLTFGTGVGGGIIIDGRLYKGNGFAGELGNIIIDKGKTFEFHWKYHKSESKKCFDKALLIREMMRRKDKDSRRILNYTYDHIAQGIVSLIHVFDPEVVVLTGGVRDAGNLFLSEIKKRMNNYLMIPRKTPIVWSKIDKAGIIGASLLV